MNRNWWDDKTGLREGPFAELPPVKKDCTCDGCSQRTQPQSWQDLVNSSESKLSNPKDSVGIRKAPMSTVPSPVLYEIGLAMLEGARKYGRHNYRAVGVRASVYFDACKRHLDAWWEGQDIDPGSGLPHLAKAAACLVVLRDSTRRGNWVDDRPPKVEGDWMEELNELAAKIIDRMPNPEEAYVEKKVSIMEEQRARIGGLALLEKAHAYESLGPCEFEPQEDKETP